MREWFDDFWQYRSLDWAGAFLDEWCVQVMRSRIEPMKKVARMLRRHRPLILNWFRARREISAGIVEGFNNKAKLTSRKAYGFRSYKGLEIALYHTLGQLPEPDTTPQILLKTRFFFVSSCASGHREDAVCAAPGNRNRFSDRPAD